MLTVDRDPRALCQATEALETGRAPLEGGTLLHRRAPPAGGAAPAPVAVAGRAGTQRLHQSRTKVRATRASGGRELLRALTIWFLTLDSGGGTIHEQPRISRQNDGEADGSP